MTAHMHAWRRSLAGSRTLDKIMGIEGACSNAYFDAPPRAYPPTSPSMGAAGVHPATCPTLPCPTGWLGADGKKILVDAYEACAQRSVTGALPGYSGSWRRHITHSAQMLARAIAKPEYQWGVVTWR